MADSDSTTPNDSSPAPSTTLKHTVPAKRPLQICIASPQFIGLTPHGGIGMAYTAMAQALAAAGHRVTCLFLGSGDPGCPDWRRWVEKYQGDGLTLVALPQIKASELVAPSHLIQSYETYHWLKRNDRFDIIHFPDQRGSGYHTLTAKRHGLAFGRTTICVGLHNMTAWLRAGDRECADMSADGETDFMERQVVALADAVVSPSHYLLNWISDHHWDMPTQRYVQQSILPRCATSPEPPVAPGWREIHELVYFGALETRHGITIFCDALDAIPPSVAENIKRVTFLGQESTVDGVPARQFVEQRARRWPFPCQINTALDQVKKMDYLRQNDRLAVIPSLLENSSVPVLECLEAGVAFIASRVGGVPEHIAPSDVSKVCFEPKPGALCLLLCSVLTQGLRPARAALDAGASEQAWVALHENSLARFSPPIQPPRPAGAGSATAAAESSHPPEFPSDAVRAAIEALSIDYEDLAALKTLARLLLQARLFEAAAEACQLVLKREPDDAEALELMDQAMSGEAGGIENSIDTEIVETGARFEPSVPLPILPHSAHSTSRGGAQASP